MAIDEVDIVELQPAQRAVDGVQQVFPVQRVILVRRFGEPQKNFVDTM